MVEEANIEFRLRKIDETRNYLLDEIKKHKSKSIKRHVNTYLSK